MPKLSQYKDRVKGKGWRPDVPSLKDWPLSRHPRLNATTSLESVDRRALGLNAPVQDQANAGSCVGHAAGYGVDFLRRTDQDKLSTIYSRLQIYFDARVRDGAQWAKVDSGAYIRDAMDALREIGTAPESAWPYKLGRNGVPVKLFTTPTASVYKKAASWKLGAHWRCETVEDICRAIDNGFAVVGGIACFSSMFTKAVADTGRIPMPSRTDAFEGGHALYWDRYSMSDRLLRCENSWSDQWGDGGYGYLPFEYAADRNLSDDFWAMEAESPATTPWED
jgi:C1A family cysteine protease